MSADAETLHTTVAGIKIAYDTTGDAGDPPVVLVSGLGGQLIAWDEGFCRELVRRGMFVVRFDNRDVGFSTHLDDSSNASASAGDVASPAVYALDDMAADTAGLITNLRLESAHVVGISLGGMIAQIAAIRYPELVRSLTSIMSTTGSDQVGHATEAALSLLLSPSPTTRDDVADQAVLNLRTMGSPGYPTDERQTRERATRAFDRAFDPSGVGRQLAAVLRTPDRTEDLRGLDLPALVIHGADDPLIAVSGGRATAAAIPGAELLVVDGMGHDLPRALWSTVADRIAALVRRAEEQQAAVHAYGGTSTLREPRA